MRRICLLMLLLFLVSCTSNIIKETHLYPGNPDEDYAPTLVVDHSYRNLALNKSAVASSNRDYNLTAQLATDGIISETLPQYFELSSSDGFYPKNEREWAFDKKTNTSVKMNGKDNYLQLDLINYTISFNHIQLKGSIQPEVEVNNYYGVPGQEAGAIDPRRVAQKTVKVKWQIVFQGSEDGLSWDDLDSKKGEGTELFLSMDNPKEYAHYRLSFSSDRAKSWTVSDWDFYNEGVTIVPSGIQTEAYFRGDLESVIPPFTSYWMSEGTQNEWIYVDLGVKASIKEIHTYWGGEVPHGSIQISNDATIWKDVAELAEIVKLSKKARYVRLSLKDGGPFVLKEFEVYGKGGLVAVPKPQCEIKGDVISLDGGDWKLIRADRVQSSGENISTIDFDYTDWIVATVPATVLSSFQHIAAIPDPNYADNQLQISDSYFLSDFWYRDIFQINQIDRTKSYFLNFDGINWKAEVFLNGVRLGDINGAFTRGKFDITEHIVTGENVLAVKIIKPAHPASVKEQTEFSTDSNGGLLGADNPTFHASVGWDWIPTIRGREVGIWNDVYITYGDVSIEDPFIYSELNLPDTTVATTYFETILKNHSTEDLSGKLCISIGDFEWCQDVVLASGEQRLVKMDPFIMESPRLWWPVGYGTPYLYDASIKFIVDGNCHAEKSLKYGVRQMTSAIVDGALNLYVNGRRFIGRGGNWGFAESNLAYRGREYDIAVRYHADMNFTMIRNWVGQIGDEEFYDACDKYGVMVWQDFWLANPWDGPDPYDEEMFMANATDYVKRIRNHPSIGLYCGRNEGMPTVTLDSALREVVEKYHTGQKYISHSAAAEVSGGGPYRALPVKTYFNLYGANRFHSERGMPNVMNYESLVRTIPEDKIWPQNNLWGMHDFTKESAQYGSSFNQMVQDGFGDVSDAKRFTELAQWINYNGYRAMFEGRGKYRQGLLLWMSHPCWPSMVWQTYDYYFDPTAAYFACKKASEPLHVQYNPLTEKVEVINLSGGDGRNVNVSADILDINGNLVWSDSLDMVSNEDTTIECFDVLIPDSISPVYYIKLKVVENNVTVSENFYWEGTEDGNYTALNQLSQAKIECESSFRKDGNEYVGTVDLVNVSDTPALMIRIIAKDGKGEQILPILYSDNYLFLMPGESKSISIRCYQSDVAYGKPSVSLTGFNLAE